MEQITQAEFNEMYEADGHTGLPKCRCCGRIDTDWNLYYKIIEPSYEELKEEFPDDLIIKFKETR